MQIYKAAILYFVFSKYFPLFHIGAKNNHFYALICSTNLSSKTHSEPFPKSIVRLSSCLRKIKIIRPVAGIEPPSRLENLRTVHERVISVVIRGTEPVVVMAQQTGLWVIKGVT